jgi:hypothetical protein
MRAARRPAAAAGARLLAHAGLSRMMPGGDAAASAARAAARAGSMHSPLVAAAAPAAGAPLRAGAPRAWHYCSSPLLLSQHARRSVVACAARERGAHTPAASPSCALDAPPAFASAHEHMHEPLAQPQRNGRVLNGVHAGEAAPRQDAPQEARCARARARGGRPPRRLSACEDRCRAPPHVSLRLRRRH